MTSVTGVINLLLGPDRNHQMQLERNMETISNLKMIGTLQPEDKIDVRNLRIENKTVFTGLKRLIMGESRKNTLSFLSGTIERSFDIIESHIHSDRISDKFFCNNIVADLIKAIEGLENVKRTYITDNHFTCKVETLIQCIQAKLAELQQKYPSLAPQSNSTSSSTSQSTSLSQTEEKKNGKK
jgi:hypothetical protein